MQNAVHSSTKIFTLLPKAVALMVMVVSGCGTSQSSVPVATSAKEAVAPASTIDAGIVFLGTETYQCYSLSRFGLQDPAAILSIDTSCECLDARVTDFVTATGERDYALRLNFLDDSDASEARSYSLAAKVILHLRDQSSQEITVRFLHAVGPETGGAP